jgi:hypothetical protein
VRCLGRAPDQVGKKEATVELTLPRDANIHAREYQL